MTNFQTPQTWLGHNTTRYHDLNVLPHALPHTLPYFCSEICLILGYLQRVTTRYRKFFKKNIYTFFINLTVTHGNPLQIAQNQENLRENVWQRVQVRVTRCIMAYPSF